MPNPENPPKSAIFIRPTDRALKDAVSGIREDIKAAGSEYKRRTQAPKAPR